MKTKNLTISDVANVIEHWTKIPVNKITEEETRKLLNLEEKMDKALSALDRDYSAIRAGRANPKVLDKITVDYYGTPTPIQQMAAVSVPEGRMLQIQPWDASTLKEVEIPEYNNLSITAGASTPFSVIQEVKQTMSEKNFAELLEESMKTLNTGDNLK